MNGLIVLIQSMRLVVNISDGYLDSGYLGLQTRQYPLGLYVDTANDFFYWSSTVRGGYSTTTPGTINRAPISQNVGKQSDLPERLSPRQVRCQM
jgi:hypothetical protein